MCMPVRKVVPAELSATICISVRKVSGQELDIEMLPQNTVRDVKRTVAQHWHFPPEHQKLVIGAKVLGDSEKLTAYCSAISEMLQITLVVQQEFLHDEPELACMEES